MPTRKITRVARRTGTTGPQPQPKVSESASLVDFLNALQQNDIALLPVSPHKGLGILGRGLSGLIQQSTADLATTLAFKEGVPSRDIHDTEQDQDWYSLVTEVTILQHAPIKANLHIVDLLGVSFSVSSSGTMGQRAWPLLVTSKVNRGDLTTILRDEKGDFLTKEVRMMLFAGFAEALFVLHSCSITHGDLKADDILVQVSENNEMRLLLIDFGSSAISGQTRTLTKSEPWNAPELEATMRNLDHDELVQIDLYSFGLVCLHLLLPLESLASAKLCLIRTQRQTDDQWAQFLSQMRHKKAFDDGEDLAFQILDAIESADASQDQKYVLKKIVESTIQPPAGKRTLPWHQLLPYIQKHLSNSYHRDSRSILHAPPLASSSPATTHSKHRIFDLGLALGELDDMDYILHTSILQDLLHKADHSVCELCRLEYAFQVSICSMIGLGCFKDAVSSKNWLMRSRRTQKGLDQAIKEIGRQYKPPGRVSKHVLDALGIGVLVSAERTQEYQTSRRLFEAERALKDRIAARAPLFGDSHLCLGKSESELSQVLQAQFHLVEAETCLLRASKILSDHLGERHPSVLMANVNLASLMAKQGLLRKAEHLVLNIQPIVEEVLGSEHTETATALQICAIIQFELGKSKEAEHLMKQVVAFRTKALTGTHPLTVRAELTLASVLRSQGRLTESSELMESIDLKLAPVLAGDSLGRAQLSIVRAMLYGTTGSLEKAFQEIAEGLAAMDMLRLPANDTLRLDGLEILSAIHRAARENGKEEAILRQILQLKGGEDERDRETTTTKSLLAGSLLAQFRLDEAYALADQVLAASGRSITQDPENYVTAIDIMAHVLAYRGQVDEAEKMRRDVLDLSATELGENNTFTLFTTYSLGIFLADRGENRKAQHLYEQALVHLEKGTQPGTDTIRVKRLLAVMLTQQGEFEKAKSECEQGIAWAISANGEHHVETLALYMALGRIFTLTEQFAEADELYSTKLQKQSAGTETEIYVLEHMAVLRKRQQRIPEAMELKRKSEALMKSVLGEFHPEFVRMQGNVLADYMDQPEHFTDEIEKDVLKNIDRKKATLGTRHPSTIMTICDLAYAYAIKGRLLEADELFHELWETAKVKAIKSPDEYARILGKRADVLFRLGRLDNAEAFEREALTIRLSIFDESHGSVLTNMSNLASTLNAQGKHEEAERYIRQVVAVRERTLEANVQSVYSFLKSRTALGAVLFYQDKCAESANIYATSIALAEEIGLPSTVVNGWKVELSEVLTKKEGNKMVTAGTTAVQMI